MLSDPTCQRTCIRLTEDLFRMDQRIEVEGKETGYDAVGPYWVIGWIQLIRGHFRILTNHQTIQPPASSFLLILPPRSVVTVELEDAVTLNSALFSRAPIAIGDTPFLIETAPNRPFTSIEEALKWIEGSTRSANISKASAPHPISLELKNYLSDEFSENRPIADILKLFPMNPEALTRAFKKDWGKPPVQFRNWVRMIESMRLIASNEAVTDAAYQVGFNDLSQFQKQFKKTAGDSPGRIRSRSKKFVFEK